MVHRRTHPSKPIATRIHSASIFSNPQSDSSIDYPGDQHKRSSTEFPHYDRTKEVDTSSLIAEHEETTGHHMDWKNFRIIWRDNNVYHLLIKESLIVRAHEPRLNRTTHSVPLLVSPEGLDQHLVPEPNG